MKFEQDSFFGSPVIPTYSEDWDETWHHINPTADDMNRLTNKVGNANTRQQGYELAVYELACNEDGSPRFKGKVMQADFFKNVDRVKARDFGMVILGFKKGDEKSDFEQGVEEELKNSEPESQDTTS